MLNVIMTVLEDVLNSKKKDLQTERELIRIHQQQRDALEKEIEALSFLLVHAPDLFKSKPPKAKWFYDTFYNGNYKDENKENSEEKINTANVAAWSNGNVPKMQNPPPPPKKESKDYEHKVYPTYQDGELRSVDIPKMHNPSPNTIPKPELLKYVRTQPSLFPNEKPVHIFIADGNEYEFYYIGGYELFSYFLKDLVFSHINEIRDGTGMVYVFTERGWDYTFTLKASKQPATNNY